jgi:hypothetical protein
MKRHREHDALVHELRGWFIHSAPEIDYVVEEHWYGYLSNPDGPIGARLILTVDKPTDISRALADARTSSGPARISVWVDDRNRVTRLHDALVAAGGHPTKATTHLALVGSLNAVSPKDHLAFEKVSLENLAEWATTKLRCFADSEEEPDPQKLARELAIRTPELALATLELARIGGEPVGVIAFYSGPDQLLFNVGTRIPYRHRGVAQALLTHWVNEGMATESRSLMINADDAGEPAKLYRHMGFVDEIYWYQEYELPSTK